MLKHDDFAVMIPEASLGWFLPVEILPGFSHIVALSPTSRPGTVAELISGAHGADVVGVFTVDRGCVGQAFRKRLALIKGYLEAGHPVAFACETKRDKAEARGRLAAIAPAGFSIRD